MKNLFVLSAAHLAVLSTLTAGDSWPSFQNGGQPGAALQSSAAVQPADSMLWTAELPGYGQSTPVIWNGQVYVTSIEGDQKQQAHVTAWNLQDGTRLWQHSLPNATQQENNSYVSRAAPTPAADSQGVICLFEGGNVVALTHAGELRWERNLVQDYNAVAARHGLAASVEQNSEHVFVWIERSEDPYVACLKKSDGSTLWKSPGLGATSWASPRLVRVSDGTHLVLSGSGFLAGLDPETGKRLWLLEEITGNSTPTPIPLDNGRFLIGATVGRGETGGGRAAESNGVVGIQQAADGTWSANYVWRAERATSSFGSPIVHNSTAWFVNREGVVYALDAETGKELFAKRLSGSSWATPVGMGTETWFFARDGRIDRLGKGAQAATVETWTTLADQLQPQTTEPPAPNPGPPGSSGPVMYAAAVGDQHLLLRTGTQMFAVALQAASATTTEGK